MPCDALVPCVSVDDTSVYCLMGVRRGSGGPAAVVTSPSIAISSGLNELLPWCPRGDLANLVQRDGLMTSSHKPCARSRRVHTIHGTRLNGRPHRHGCLQTGLCKAFSNAAIARALLQPARVSKSANQAAFGAGQFPGDPIECEAVSPALGSPGQHT